MATNQAGRKGNTLAQAASVVFALVAVIPLLLFLYSLYSLDALGRTRYQITLAVALGVALFGLYILRLMVHRMSALIRAVPRVTAAAETAGGETERSAREGAPRRSEVQILGIGSVQEFGEMNEILDHMWRTEARHHMGRPVRISLRDGGNSVTGTVARIAPRSLILENDGRQESVEFDRMAAIEPTPISPSSR